MKKIFFIVIIFIIVFLIYYLNINKNIYYVSIGDNIAYGINNLNQTNNNYNTKILEYYNSSIEKYINYSSINDYRVMDLINDINYNKDILINNKEYKIQNILIKSNLLIISIGMNDIISKKNINYDYIDELLIDIEELLTLIRKYNKDKIYFLSFYNIINNKNIIEYANKKLQIICNNVKVNFVDISNLNIYIINNTNPTSDGYDYIYKKILTLLK